MTQKIDKDVMQRAQAVIDAAEAAKPQPPMTDELRAEVEAERVKMIEGQARDYKRAPKAEPEPGADANPSTEPPTATPPRQGRRG